MGVSVIARNHLKDEIASIAFGWTIKMNPLYGLLESEGIVKRGEIESSLSLQDLQKVRQRADKESPGLLKSKNEKRKLLQFLSQCMETAKAGGDITITFVEDDGNKRFYGEVLFSQKPVEENSPKELRERQERLEVRLRTSESEIKEIQEKLVGIKEFLSGLEKEEVRNLFEKLNQQTSIRTKFIRHD